MSRLVNTLDRVTWLLERVNELAHGEVLCLSKATLDCSSAIAQDFALIRPILDTLLLSRVSPVPRMDSFSRTLSAPLEATVESTLDEAAVVKEAKPLQSARFNSYTKAGIDPVEAFALLSSTDASNYFDMVLACGLRNGEESKVAAELFVKEMWYSGLCLDLKNLRLSPRLLARLAHQVAGKQELHRVTKQLLPDLCQGVSPDGLLQKIVRAKREMRKSMLSGYMQALDESEGLQDTIARLTARMGVEPSSLRSDTGLTIPLHVRQYLQKLEAYSRDRKRLSELEMQIVVLRALGAKDPKDDINFDPSRPMLPRILEQLKEEAEENEAPNNPRRASGLAKMASSPCTFGPDGRSPLPGHLTAALRGLSIEH